MASVRTPAQLAIVRDSMNRIADPTVRRNALRDLQSEIIQAGSTSTSDKDSPYTDQDYQGLLTAVQSDITQVGQDIRDVTPTQRTPEQKTVDQATANQAGALDAQRTANQKAGKGFYTDAEVATLARQATADQAAAAKAPVDLATAQANLEKTRLELARLVANDPSKLEEAKFTYQQQHDALTDLFNANKLKSDQESAARTQDVAQRGQDVTALTNLTDTYAKDLLPLSDAQQIGTIAASGSFHPPAYNPAPYDPGAIAQSMMPARVPTLDPRAIAQNAIAALKAGVTTPITAPGAGPNNATQALPGPGSPGFAGGGQAVITAPPAA